MDANGFRLMNITSLNMYDAVNKSWVLNNTASLDPIVTNATQYYLLNGTRLLTGDMDANGMNIMNITSLFMFDAVNKSWVLNNTADIVGTNLNSSHWGSTTKTNYFLSNETVFSTPIVRLPHVLNSTTTLIDVVCIGGGGGGGGVAGAASTAAGAAGGGSGGYGEAWFNVVPSATVWISVGYNGTGGTTGATAGMIGKPSNLTYGASFINCSGGAGGAPMTAGTLFTAVAGGASGTTWAVGVRSSQYINYGLNESGWNGYSFSTVGAMPGSGGSDTLGAGARATSGSGGKGTSCSQGYGGGGAGANSTAAINAPGGGGCSGAIILREYAT
jgi:hypothetical protein